MLTATFSRKGKLISERFHEEATDRSIEDLIKNFVDAAWDPINAALEEVDRNHGLYAENCGEEPALQAN